MIHIFQSKYAAAAILLLCGLLAYMAGFSGGFTFDDYPNIVTNSFVNRESWSLKDFWIAMLSGEAGPTGRPVAMLSFALDSFWCGLDPGLMKLENAIIHALSACMAFFLIRRLLVQVGESNGSAHVVALVSALCWAVHPFNLTSVLYVVQRMNCLSALFCFSALWAFVVWRQRMAIGSFSYKYAFLVIAFFVLSVFSKENGVLFCIYAVLIELFVFSNKTFSSKEKRYRTFLLLSVGLCALLVWYVVIFNGSYVSHSYRIRDFTVDQRLLTEFRVLSWYVYQLFFPSIQDMSLYHDNIVLSESIASPITTLYSIIFIFLLIVLAGILRHRVPAISLAIFIFLSSQLIETFVFALELAYEHRVYFGGFWLIFAVVYLGRKLFDRVQESKVRFLIASLPILFSLIFSFQSYLRADEWSSPGGLIMSEVQRSPDSYRANVQAGGLYASRMERVEDTQGRYITYLQSMEYFETAMELNPSAASACIAALILETSYSERLPGEYSISRCRLSLAYAVDSSSLSSLGLLVKCMAEERCVRGDYALQLLDVAYDTVGDRRKRDLAILLSSRASYFMNVNGDYQRASFLLKRAIELQPKNDIYYVRLIDSLVSGGDLAKARAVGESLRKIDPYGVHDEIYEALRSGG